MQNIGGAADSVGATLIANQNGALNSGSTGGSNRKAEIEQALADGRINAQQYAIMMANL